ncbi:MAG: DUF4403 family protein [Saprospiraceae bacterium]
MNEDVSGIAQLDCSSIQVEIIIEESWINQFIREKQIVLTLDEKNHLTTLQVSIRAGSLSVSADILEKDGSSLELNAQPEWDANRQQLSIKDVKLQTSSKNLWVKSAGWFAQAFLNSRIDKKIADQANLLYRTQLEKILKEPVHFPIPKTGGGEVDITAISVRELIFTDQAIRVKATIDGYWKLYLTNSKQEL